MTRLTGADIAQVTGGLGAYTAELQRKTGLTLLGVACRAVSVPEGACLALAERTTAAVVPVSWGQGRIAGFAAAVCGVLRSIGLRAFVTASADVRGLAEAVGRKSDLVFLSDDDDFVALNPAAGCAAFNAECTGKGFAAGLDVMAGGLAGREALVLGCGPVGRGAALLLAQRGVRVTVFDPAAERCRRLVEEARLQSGTEIMVAADLRGALREHRHLVDASPAAGIIDDTMITSATCIAAPGLPLGLTPSAARKAAPRLLHDPLQIGVATMAAAALAPAVALQLSR